MLGDVDSVLLLIVKLFDKSLQTFAVFKDVQASYSMKEFVLVQQPLVGCPMQMLVLDSSTDMNRFWLI
jgi:hypothetical protein